MDNNPALKIMLDTLAHFKESMNAYKLEFDKVEVEISETNAKIKALNERREQIRGTYTSLYNEYNNLYNAMQSSNLIPTDATPASAKTEVEKPKEEVPVKKEVEKVDKKKTTKTEDNNKSASLTPDEVKVIQEKIKKANTPNPSDIPDYLQEEYKKQ